MPRTGEQILVVGGWRGWQWVGVQTDFIVYLMFKLNNIQKQFREIEGKNKKLLLIKGRLSKFVDNSGCHICSALSNIYINSGPCGGIVRFAHKFFGSLYAFGKDTQTSQQDIINQKLKKINKINKFYHWIIQSSLHLIIVIFAYFNALRHQYKTGNRITVM